MTELFSSFLFIQVGVSAPLPSQGSPLISPSVLEATPSSQFDPSIGVMLHFVDEDSNLVSNCPYIDFLCIASILTSIHISCSLLHYVKHPNRQWQYVMNP